jgi:Ca-activated chloride channel family protein
VEPFHVVLLLDVSGSTTLKHGDIQSAALAFLESMRPKDQVMVSSFSAAIHVDSEFTSDRDQLGLAILLTKVGTSTRLYDALELVVTQRLNEIQGRKAIVLLTDGMDTASRLSDLNISLARIEESDVLVYVLQYDTRKDLPNLSQSVAPSYARASEYLRDLSVNSGGRRFDASSVLALRDAFAQIAEELRHQYALCYYPAFQATDSSFRRIQVTVDRPGVRIRARVGYRPAVRR